MNCTACNKKINGNRNLQCSRCGSKYHTECLNLKNEQFYALSADYCANWVCPSCSNITRRANKQNENTPVRNTQVPTTDESMNMSYDLTDQSAPQPSILFSGASTTTSADNNIVTMDKISTLLDQKLNSTLSVFMNDFRKTLKEDVKALVRKEIDSTVQKLKDDFTVTTNFICDEQSSLKREIEQKARAMKDLEAEISGLRNEQSGLIARISSMERMTRSQNVEIQAVPESKNENPVGIFNNLCKTLNLEINQDQIHSCRRVAKVNTTSDRPRNLLVTLINPRMRDNLLSACYRFNRAHKGDTLNTSHLGLTCEKRRIYVTEHLSPECKALHAAARKAAKEKSYKYVWVKYGRVYLRKDDGANCILVKNVDTLNKLV